VRVGVNDAVPFYSASVTKQRHDREKYGGAHRFRF
jgi:hypothetical protein